MDDFSELKSKSSARADRFDDVSIETGLESLSFDVVLAPTCQSHQGDRPSPGWNDARCLVPLHPRRHDPRTHARLRMESSRISRGMTIKAVAYKSDFGDSRVVEAAYPPANPK